MKPELSIVIPVYNEENSVAPTIDSIKKVMDSVKKSYEIIAVNDGSKDSSGKVLSQISGIKFINNPYNLGYGASLKRGINEAEADWILITDADGTYPVSMIPELLKHTNDYDMVVGARRGKNVSDQLGRKPAKWFLRTLASLVAGKKIPDINSGMRVFRKDLAKKYFHLYPSGFSFTTTITVAFLSHDHTVKFIDIPYHKRVGKSSMKPRHFLSFINLIAKLFIYFKPVKMITPLAFVLFLIGVILAVKNFYTTNTIGAAAIILILVAFQTFFLALMTDAIIKSRY